MHVYFPLAFSCVPLSCPCPLFFLLFFFIFEFPHASNLFALLSRLPPLPDMSAPDAAAPRGLLPPGLRRRLDGYFGIRSRFQAAAWCELTLFFLDTYLLAP